jgi:AraC family transcriptional regulator
MENAPPRRLKPATRLDYGRRIARAMALITADPRHAPSLEEMAETAAFSPFHFHRLYRELTGETPAETLARERLSRAAAMLARGGIGVAAVARACGYGSAAAFTRAFRAAYGLPPGTYRDQGGIGAPLPHPTRTEEENAMFDVQIREEPALRLATLPHRGPYAQIGTVFDRLMAWGVARGLVRDETRFIALYHDDPVSVAEAELRSEAGFTVGSEVQASEGVTIRELPATRVAVLVFKGPYAELEPAYTWLYRDWLPGSGEEPADQPPREDYLNDPRALPPSEWLTAVMLPLREKVLSPG